MLDHFGKTELKALVASEGGPHLSFYLSTHTSAAEVQQDVLRVKNLLQDAETQLTEGWMRNKDAREFLAPIDKLVRDEAFWSQRHDGLAMFLANDQLRVFRLAFPFDERLSISREFFLRPIIPVCHRQPHGLVLTLSEKKVALYEISNQSIQPVAVPDLPVNLEETLNYTSVDRGQQVHSGAPAAMGKRADIYHGHGGTADTHKDDLRHFFRAVDAAVASHLGDSTDMLIVACVDSSVPIYREVNSYSGLLSENISGNVDYLTPHELLAKSLPILQAEQTRQREGLIDRIRQRLNTSIASANSAEVIRAAFQGRVHTVFFDERAIVKGQFDPILQTAVVYPNDSPNELGAFNTDLIESALVQTLRHNGDVYSVSESEMPEHAPLAALFRY